jgi:hypothetical protein
MSNEAKSKPFGPHSEPRELCMGAEILSTSLGSQRRGREAAHGGAQLSWGPVTSLNTTTLRQAMSSRMVTLADPMSHARTLTSFTWLNSLDPLET